MEKVVIRKATLEDAPAIVEAHEASVLREETEGCRASEWTTYSSAEELSKAWDAENKLKDGSEVLVAEKHGDVVGFIVFGFEQDWTYIDDVYVTKPEQGKGIGRALVAHVERTAVANGFKSVRTDTTENAEGVPWMSYGFWTRMGYEDTGQRLLTSWGFKTIPFVKDLSRNHS